MPRPKKPWPERSQGSAVAVALEPERQDEIDLHVARCSEKLQSILDKEGVSIAELKVGVTLLTQLTRLRAMARAMTRPAQQAERAVNLLGLTRAGLIALLREDLRSLGKEVVEKEILRNLFPGFQWRKFRPATEPPDLRRHGQPTAEERSLEPDVGGEAGTEV